MAPADPFLREWLQPARGRTVISRDRTLPIFALNLGYEQVRTALHIQRALAGVRSCVAVRTGRKRPRMELSVIITRRVVGFRA